MKVISMILILGIIALAVILSASAAGQGGNGKMLQSGTEPGTNGIDCPNPDCQKIDCQNTLAPPQDGTGMQNGIGNLTCNFENCPNNGTQKRDGTGQKIWKKNCR